MFTAPSPSSQSTACGVPLAHEGEREPGRDRQLAGDDPPAAVVAARDVEQVHRAAAAVRAAVVAAEQLGHHRLGRTPRASAKPWQR